MCCYGEVMWPMSLAPAQGIARHCHGTVLAHDWQRSREKLLYRERILEISKYILGSSFSGPGNEARHWADCLYAEIYIELRDCATVNNKLLNEGHGYN